MKDRTIKFGYSVHEVHPLGQGANKFVQLVGEKSGGKKSLDDFARGFFGVEDGRTEVLPYTFDDVVKALNSVLPYR